MVFCAVIVARTALRLKFSAAGAVCAGLCAIAADLHRAHRARAVARAVVDRPLAVVGSADLEPRPLPAFLGGGHDRQQPRVEDAAAAAGGLLARAALGVDRDLERSPVGAAADPGK